MPSLTPCLGCGRLVRGASRCPACDAPRRALDSARRNAKPERVWWRTPEARRMRAEVLERDGHRCADCGGPARSVDHPPGSRDPRQWKARCASCHGRRDGGRRR